jgi:hypothetical protein
VEPIEILRKFIGPPEKDRPWMSYPFLNTFDGVDWSVGTCGHTLLAVKGQLASKVRDAPRMRILALPRDPTCIKIIRKELLDWAGVDNPDLVGFSKKPIGKSHQGILIGVHFDIRKLAYLIDNIPSDKLYVWDSTVPMEVRSLTFESEDGNWRGVVAGLDGTPTTNRVFRGSGAEYDDDFRRMLEL